MNRFKHFPASEMMTEFEIVEIQNEMLRQRKIQKELEQDSTPEDSESEEDSSTKESSTMIDSQNIDLSDNDMISDMTEEEFSMDNHVLSLQSSEDDLLNNISLESLVNSQPSKTNSDSNDSNQSFKTPPNSISSLLDESKEFPTQGCHSHRIQQYQILDGFKQSQHKTRSSRINCQNGIPI